MARRVFFSFHYERDVWRASQVRNCWVTQERQSVGFWDAAAWEEVKKKGQEAVQKWIDEQLIGTSVTVVLIGAETAQRPYVGYEIKSSRDRGSGLLGIRIQNMRDSNGNTDAIGSNPLSDWQTQRDGKAVPLSEIYPTYDWINDNGRNKVGDWIEAAAKKAGR
jgi:hypothetical protein